MGFRDKFKKTFDSGNEDLKSSGGTGFARLEGMVSAGKGEVVLDSDIALGDREAEKYQEGIVVNDDIVIDGQGHSIDACRKARIFKITGGNVVFKNITFINGEALEGAAIYVDSFAEVEITDCKFTDNHAESKGSAIANLSKITLKGVEFSENIADNAGGAVFNEIVGDLKFIDCSFNDNASQNGGGALFNSGKATLNGARFEGNTSRESDGGALNNQSSGKASLADCTFNGNTSQKAGGALVNFGKASLDDVEFSQNTSRQTNGGAIYNKKGTLTLTDCSLSDNSSPNGGGALFNQAKATLNNVKFEGNVSSESHGGALKNDEGGEMSVRGGSFRQNTSKKGGGALINFGQAGFDSVDFILNVSNEGAGGGFNNQSGDVTLKDCSFNANSSKSGGGGLINFGQITLDNVDFTENTTEDDGGALNNQNDCDATLSGCTFKDNSSQEGGGAMINKGKAELSACDFTGNTSNESDGGALNNQSSGNAALKDCSFNANTSKKGGGGLINFGQITLNNTDFTGNASDESDGGALNNQNDGDASITECTFNANTSKNGGGAIVNFGQLTLNNTDFTQNSSDENDGGALNNQSSGNVSLSECTFKENSSKNGGGAIVNFGQLTLNNGDFTQNTSRETNGGAMVNLGRMDVGNSTFKGNGAHHGGAIFNGIDGNLTLSNTSFIKNITKGDGGAVNNNKETSELNADGCRFISNRASAGGGAIVSWGNVSISNSGFEDNFAETNGNDINFQTGTLEISNASFNEARNESIFSADDSLVKIEGCRFIEQDYDDILSESGERNFRYLDALLHSGGNEVVLDSDILLDEREANRYLKGISLDNMDLTIDGNGHCIDAAGKVRIFTLKGNITLKNLTLKNGRSKEDYGGAIYHKDNSNLVIENVSFSENAADIEGGAIVNFGNVRISNSNFEKCHADDRGGAIFNNSNGTLTLEVSRFIENTSKSTGGAVHNFGKATVSGGEFSGNSSQKNGGAMMNLGELTLEGVDFTGNSSENGEGGALNNQSDLGMSCINCSFDGNSSPDYGGAVMNLGKITVEESHFNGNDSSNGGAIYNYKGDLKLSKSSFTQNSSNRDGAAINIDEESAGFDADGCRFSENVSKEDGGAIVIWADSSIRNCEFTDNSAKERGNDLAIFAGSCELADLTFNDFRKSSVFFKGDEPAGLEGCLFREPSVDESDDEPQLRNFSHLDSLIRSGEREISLDSDIMLGDGEEDIFEGGIEIGTAGLVIDGAGHTIDAGGMARIFTISAEGISLKGITFCNGYSDGGSAILCRESSALKITDCRFEQNSSTSGGGAIQNRGNVTVEGSVFEDNTSSEGGGAIFNEADADLTIANTDFLKNATEGEGGAINNNRTSSRLDVEGCRFIENTSQSDGGALINWGNASIAYSKFQDNASQRQGNDIDAESGMLKLSDVKFESTRDEAIFSIEDDLLSLEGCEFIEADADEIVTDERNFTYLDRLASTGKGSIVLDSDITLEGTEAQAYRDGIRLEADGLVIDGAGHAIDADGSARIFHVLGKEITFTNITFQNGSNDVGGAVYVGESGDLKIEDCIFTDNAAESNGGAIFNNGKINLKDVSFENNTANGESGGAVSNQDGEMSLCRCSFRKNSSQEDGGAIFNWGEISLEDVNFERNTASIRGGAIGNQPGGKVSGDNCSFRQNRAEEGGAVYAVAKEDVDMEGSTFRDNVPDDKGFMI